MIRRSPGGVGSLAADDLEVELTEAPGVGDHVDPDDFPPRDGEGEHDTRAPLGRPHAPGRAIYERQLRPARPTRSAKPGPEPACPPASPRTSRSSRRSPSQPGPAGPVRRPGLSRSPPPW